MKMDAEFMQWSFKIAPCTKAYDHEWSTCPYVHEGEKMRRRDPRTHSCHACPLSKQKKPCPLGDACQHAHNVYECGFHPDRFRTKYCRSGATCRRWNCFFAHSVEELRDPHAASATAAADASDSRTDSLDAFTFGTMEAALPMLPGLSKHAQAAGSLGSFLPTSSGLASLHSVSSGLCMPAMAPLPDLGSAGGTSNSGFLGMECSKSLVSSGSLSPGGSSSAINSGSSCGMPNSSFFGTLSTSGGMLLQHDGAAANSCPITLAPPATTSAAYDHLLQMDQQSQWRLQQQGATQPGAMQWLPHQQQWQHQQPAASLEWPQPVQQSLLHQRPSPSDQAALRQLLAAPGGPIDAKNGGDMLHVMAMALGMDLHTLRQPS